MLGVLAMALVGLLAWTASSPRSGGNEATVTDQLALEATASSPSAEATSSAVEVAVPISKRAFPDGAGVPNVLLTKDRPSADALASSGLQGLFSAPLLLTDAQQLSPETAAEIDRFGDPDIHLLGGSEAVSPAIEKQLADGGHAVHRHAGPTGLQTSIDIARRHFGSADTAVLTSIGGTDADALEVLAEALPASSLAAARQLPILFTPPYALSPTTAEYLRSSPIQNVLVVGDDSVIGDEVLADIAILGLAAQRVSGDDRYGTAVAVAESRGFINAGDAPVVILVEGSAEGAWPSSFLAAVNTGRFGGAPVLLADGDRLPQQTRDFLTPPEGQSSFILCSPGVSEAACSEARGLVNR